jgi:hypothetical protein
LNGDWNQEEAILDARVYEEPKYRLNQIAY